MFYQKQQFQGALIKIVILGSINAGKTSLLLRLSQDRFSEQLFTTIGLDYQTKQIHIDNEPLQLQIWDTHGSDGFRASIQRITYLKANGIFYPFDVSSENSFQEMLNIYESISLLNQVTMADIKRSNKNISFVLIGCKSDLKEKRAISYDSVMSLASSMGMHYIETSAKMNLNCLEAIEHLSRLCLAQMKNNEKQKIPLANQNIQENKTCW